MDPGVGFCLVLRGLARPRVGQSLPCMDPLMERGPGHRVWRLQRPPRPPSQ